MFLFHEFVSSIYNPLLNLKWNELDKIWMNEKIIDERFIPKYRIELKKKKKDVLNYT